MPLTAAGMQSGSSLNIKVGGFCLMLNSFEAEGRSECCKRKLHDANFFSTQELQ